MSDSFDAAIAAGDGTLHGAIDYWQDRTLKAESENARLLNESVPVSRPPLTFSPL